jgi:CBS domain-containing protein
MSVVRELLKIKGRDVWSVEPKTSLLQALQLMAEKNVGALLIMEGEKLSGIFSERDYARNSILRGRSCISGTVGPLMTRDVIYISPEDSFEECMALMSEKHIRHLPVLDQEQVVGMITMGDVVKEIISAQQYKIHELKKLAGSNSLSRPE